MSLCLDPRWKGLGHVERMRAMSEHKDKLTIAVEDILARTKHLEGKDFVYGWQTVPDSQVGAMSPQSVDDDNDAVYLPPINFTESNKDLDQWFRDVGSHVEFRGHGPRWHRPSDTLIIPAWDQWIEPEKFYSTMAHEHIHWTGASYRLHRPWPNEPVTWQVGMNDYRREEIVAEIGCMFWEIQMDYPVDYGQHAAYVSNWARTQSPPIMQQLFGSEEDAKDLPQISHHWIETVAAKRAVEGLAYLNRCVAMNRDKVSAVSSWL